MKKIDAPYYQAAREALINWNGLTEEEADKFIEESSFEEIEAKVDGERSVTDAAKTIGKILGLNDEEIVKFVDEVFGRTESTEMTEKVSKELGKANFGAYLSNGQKNMPKLIVDTMEAVHDGWVASKSKIFLTEKAKKGKQYQYLPLELIGWDEAKSDLLFIRPIIHAIGGYVDEAELKEECNKRTIDFFMKHSDRGMDGTLGMNIHNLDDLGNWIVENGLEYDPWSAEIDDNGTTIEDAMKDSEFVKGTILPELREKGFMKDEELMDKLSYGDDPIFEADGPSKNEMILAYLKQQKKDLENEEKEISAEEKSKKQDGEQGQDHNE